MARPVCSTELTLPESEVDMIWALLAFLGVPLWMCAIGILILVLRSRRLRNRAGDVPVRVLRPGHTRWARGHAVWVADVFAWRGSPAAWAEDLIQVIEIKERPADPEEIRKLHRLGEGPAVVELAGAQGETLTVATAAEHRAALFGPFTLDGSTSAAEPADTAPPTV
jgi:hypothetical protein